MLHRNYPSNLAIQYGIKNQKMKADVIYNITESLNLSNHVDALVFSNQCWNLQHIYGILSCGILSFYINKMPNKKNINHEITYIKDYNKTSIKQINLKVMKKAKTNEKFGDMNIYDFIYMSNIFKKLMNNKKYDEIVSIAKKNNISFKEIESIIKIDKTDKFKFPKGNDKEKIKKMIEN